MGGQVTQPHELMDYSTTKTFDLGGDCNFKIIPADFIKLGTMMQASMKAAGSMDGKASPLKPVITGHPISMPFDPGGAGMKTPAFGGARGVRQLLSGATKSVNQGYQWSDGPGHSHRW